VPVSKAAVQKAINEAYYGLLSRKPTLLNISSSYNFPKDTHPVAVSCGLNNDIKQTFLRIDGPLRQCSILVPWTSTGNSQSPFNAPLVTYISGTSASYNTYLAGVIPGGVSTALGGILALVGAFIPRDSAFQYDGTTSGPDDDSKLALYSSKVDWAPLPNVVSGPGVYPAAVAMHFSPEANPRHTLGQMREMVNQPFILGPPYNLVPSEKPVCQRNTYYFDNDTAQVQYRSGRVTFGAAGNGVGVVSGTLEKASMDGSGDYEDVHGFGACLQLVGYGTIGGQDCEEAARDVREGM
jgi:hypothetical protein